MKTDYGHLTYCSNIHAGEEWGEHFAALKAHIPAIKSQTSPEAPFGIGLRLSERAVRGLGVPGRIEEFRLWLADHNCYVFTMNGFPYGGFHRTVVKDQVHAPDWLTGERSDYTIRMFHILSQLLPEGMEGGISTSPLSYRHWHEERSRADVSARCTGNLLNVVSALIEIERVSGKTMHLDLEPEPDGLIETGTEFIYWYEKMLMPMGCRFLSSAFGMDEGEADAAIRRHVRLCYDICHFAVGFENHHDVLNELAKRRIPVGKLQISAALKASFSDAALREDVRNAFRAFNESTYLHQVVASSADGILKRYRDLGEALSDVSHVAAEWRSHFHVPLFVGEYGELHSTQEDITSVIGEQTRSRFTDHLEVETYTWEVLPDELRLPLSLSIIRELEWVKALLKN